MHRLLRIPHPCTVAPTVHSRPTPLLPGVPLFGHPPAAVEAQSEAARLRGGGARLPRHRIRARRCRRRCRCRDPSNVLAKFAAPPPITTSGSAPGSCWGEHLWDD
eukprot:scaffold98331_cov48-Phaeocystis_antarctica.AAC.2